MAPPPLEKNKVALVTGGNRGIGLGIVEGLAREGFYVYMGCRNTETGKLALDFLEEYAGKIEMIKLDVTRKESINQAAVMVEKKSGKLDVLVNNAGIIGKRKSALKDGDVKEMKEVMKVNFYGPMRMIHAFLPLLRKSRDGRIINVSSGMGALDDLFGGYAAYRLSKAGLNAQTILISNDLRGDRIKVFAMCPGWVKTEMGGAEAPRSVEKGAETVIWLATTDAAETGKFYRDMNIIPW